MRLDGPRNQFDGELAALQSRREMESLSTSSVSSVLSEIADVVGQFGVPGAGLFAKVLKSSQTPVEKVVEQVENGAYIEIARIRKHYEEQNTRLGEHDARFKEFEARLRSQEAQSAYLGAVLHGLRTSDPRKHIRLGTLTINCVYCDDLEPESLDGMMRAAVELTERDIFELGAFISRQSAILAQAEKLPMQWYDNVRRHWQAWAIENSAAFRSGKLSYFELNSSRSKLAAFGFIIAIPAAGTTNSPDVFPYALLPEGKRFYERLQETAVNTE